MIQRTLFGAAGLLAVGLSVFATDLRGQSSPLNSDLSATTVTGITAPSQRLKLASPVPGIVLERAVKSGETVTKGQVLIRLDDTIEKSRLASLEMEAASTGQIDAALAQYELNKVQLARKEKLLQDRAGSVSEVEQARLEVEIGQFREKIQREAQAIKALERDAQKLKVELMELKSPIDGQVESIDVGPGEWADPQKQTGAVTVVQNNPLWVEVHLPTRQSQHLDRNAPLMVKHVGDEKAQAIPAKIIYINPVADAASDTQLVRLELPNPDNRSSGLQVSVTLPENVAALAEGR
ncbi:MAG TPA: efflux RND transporter periplasmic adaptor subunit [Tepidisphaeraceae bacterium]|jgi:RND family efflux transporter MFP subunit|nr:efflux RND transporter periplasmic adaptor subunit [Tepidisphaeraceae bacterium]